MEPPKSWTIDFLHAVAAQKAGVEELLTLDENDFEQLLDNLKVRQV